VTGGWRGVGATARWRLTCMCDMMVAPSLVMMTSPSLLWIILSMPLGPRDVRTASATPARAASGAGRAGGGWARLSVPNTVQAAGAHTCGVGGEESHCHRAPCPPAGSPRHGLPAPARWHRSPAVPSPPQGCYRAWSERGAFKPSRRRRSAGQMGASAARAERSHIHGRNRGWRIRHDDCSHNPPFAAMMLAVRTSWDFAVPPVVRSTPPPAGLAAASAIGVDAGSASALDRFQGRWKRGRELTLPDGTVGCRQAMRSSCVV